MFDFFGNGANRVGFTGCFGAFFVGFGLSRKDGLEAVEIGQGPYQKGRNKANEGYPYPQAPLGLPVQAFQSLYAPQEPLVARPVYVYHAFQHIHGRFDGPKSGNQAIPLVLQAPAEVLIDLSQDLVEVVYFPVKNALAGVEGG